MITLIANIADNIRWGQKLPKDLDQGLEVWNRVRAESQPKRPNVHKIDVGR